MSRQKANEQINNRMMPGHDQEKKGKKTPLIIAVSACGVILAVAALFFLFSEASPFGGRDTYQGNTVVTPENVERIAAQLMEAEAVPPGSYEVSMNTTWTFADGASISSDAYVENSVTNASTVYFIIRLKDDDAQIYESPYLEPGSYMNDIRLDTELAAGTYDAIMTYHLVDSNYNNVSRVSVGLEITVLN
jgi:hypothetical protein